MKWNVLEKKKCFHFWVCGTRAYALTRSTNTHTHIHSFTGRHSIGSMFCMYVLSMVRLLIVSLSYFNMVRTCYCWCRRCCCWCSRSSAPLPYIHLCKCYRFVLSARARSPSFTSSTQNHANLFACVPSRRLVGIGVVSAIDFFN